jgi:hypothetical protein
MMLQATKADPTDAIGGVRAARLGLIGVSKPRMKGLRTETQIAFILPTLLWT